MANVSPGSGQHGQRPAGTRFRDAGQAPAQGNAGSRPPAPSPYARNQGARSAAGGSHRRAAMPSPQFQALPNQQAGRSAQGGVQPSYQRRGQQPPRKTSPVPVIIAVLVAVLAVAGIVTFVFPRVFGGKGAQSTVEAGQPVTLTVPEGASGDVIASLLSENHVVEDPSEYYAAVKKLNAEMSLKPGDYQFTTLQDPVEVVKQLMNGPNVEGNKITVPEGKTVDQTAALVEQTFGIPAVDFIAQAKASNYAADYPFVASAANDSLEGFLYPKTYTFSDTPTADQIIRAMLDQYQADVLNALDFAAGRAAIQSRYGVELSDYDVLNLASVVEREGLDAKQRAHVASVFLNRLSGRLTDGVTLLNSDATMMYVTGGAVTAEDLQRDDPYNSYKNPGLPPTPICSPSLEAIQATLNPTDSDDLYFYITQDEEYFSKTYDEHMQSWE